MSLPARGVWIEIHAGRRWNPATARSLPARGVWIEIGFGEMLRERRMSLPARGVWIEIITGNGVQKRGASLPARGVWIEITRNIWVMTCMAGRSPQGECGLKYRHQHSRG